MKTNTRIDALVPWYSNFYDELPMYEPIRKWASCYSRFQQWPGLDDYRRLLREHPPIRTLNGMALSIVEQGVLPGPDRQYLKSSMKKNQFENHPDVRDKTNMDTHKLDCLYRN